MSVPLRTAAANGAGRWCCPSSPGLQVLRSGSGERKPETRQTAPLFPEGAKSVPNIMLYLSMQRLGENKPTRKKNTLRATRVPTKKALCKVDAGAFAEPRLAEKVANHLLA